MRERSKRGEREREREEREKKGDISSVFQRLELDGSRRKVDPRIASYVWVPKSWSFVKLHEVGNFPTWNIFSLKKWFMVVKGPRGALFIWVRDWGHFVCYC